MVKAKTNAWEAVFEVCTEVLKSFGVAPGGARGLAFAAIFLYNQDLPSEAGYEHRSQS